MSVFTLVLYPTVPAFTNEWNDFRNLPGWASQVRGNFPTEQAACERAREMLPHGAPFTIKAIDDEGIAPDDDETRWRESAGTYRGGSR